MTGDDAGHRRSPLGLAARILFWVAGISLAFDVEARFHYEPGLDRWYVTASAGIDLILLLLAVAVRRGASWALGLATATFLLNSMAGWMIRESLIWLAWQLAVAAILTRHLFAALSRA